MTIQVSKIRAGKAHELSEGDTNYLGACTKGNNADKSLVQQPFNTRLAKQRAYSLKTTYMTRLLRKYIFGETESPHIIKDVSQLKTINFEDLILNRFMKYKGWTEEEISKEAGFNTEKKPKNHYACLTNYMLGLGASETECEEFKSANIQVKSLHVNYDGTIKESVSFPEFSFLDLIEQDWESSDLYNDVVSARFLFVIYRIDESGNTRLETAKFWNMPNKDAEEVHRVWKKTIEEIKKGAGLHKSMWGRNERIENSLPGIKDSPIAHVRPHAGKAAYKLKDGTIIGDIYKHANPLPNGEWMTKQCFWLNSSYVADVIRDFIKPEKERTIYTIIPESEDTGSLMVAIRPKDQSNKTDSKEEEFFSKY